MSNPRPDPRYASAQGPVNRRTALRDAPAAAPPPEHPRVRQQLLDAQARQRLGAPLARQLDQQSAAHRGAPPTGVQHAVLALAPLAGLAGAWIAWQQASALGLAAGAALLLGSAAGTLWALRSRRRQRARGPAGAMPTGPVFDPLALARLDQVLELLAPQVPADTLTRLAGIKSTFVRMAPLLGSAVPNEHFTVDDRLYIAECLRRYLPDSLQGWLQVPSHLREVPGDGAAPSAQALLDQQLDLLQEALHQRERKLGQAATEQLQQQQRFLKAKHGG